MIALILLIAAAFIAGYYLSRSKYSEQIDDATEKVSSTSKSWTDKAGGWVQDRVGRGKDGDSFKEWATGPGAEYMPDDFKEWVADLSDEETETFTQALVNYSKGLGFDLSALEKGVYDNNPALMQVYVEAVVVYSQEYRKARQAHLESEEVAEQAEDESKAEASTKAAQKSTSRRKKEEVNTTEAATA
jgi:hypothetical protein